MTLIGDFTLDPNQRPNSSQVYRLQLPPPEGNGLQSSIGSLAFDTHQELLWVGNECVRRKILGE